ncbi:uncharacterized protein LOC122306493 [Carya illinoinensis]|uniref:uncharacterized protein LOC122306493 n=1 Tax=Carya illinoinensis TaxID=32201 RepID=UPI001C7217DE|nr:uncharacterized protein LOC122306493 [Carya illinoinensis]
MVDKWIWECERSGQFSVKSYYRLIMQHKNYASAEGSNCMRQHKLWKLLWKMLVPNKVRVFARCACKEVLPTKKILLKKHVITEENCCFCLNSIEDCIMQFLAVLSRERYGISFFPSLDGTVHAIFFDLVLQLFEGEEVDRLSLFFSLTWGLWYRRNKKEFEQQILSVKHVTKHASCLMKNFKEVKLNVDGVLFGDLNKAGLGLLLRDAARNVIMATSKAENDVESQKTVELLAVFRELQLCSSMGITNIMLRVIV